MENWWQKFRGENLHTIAEIQRALGDTPIELALYEELYWGKSLQDLYHSTGLSPKTIRRILAIAQLPVPSVKERKAMQKTYEASQRGTLDIFHMSVQELAAYRAQNYGNLSWSKMARLVPEFRDAVDYAVEAGEVDNWYDIVPMGAYRATYDFGDGRGPLPFGSEGERLTGMLLYYFWYTQCSSVDHLEPGINYQVFTTPGTLRSTDFRILEGPIRRLRTGWNSFEEVQDGMLLEYHELQRAEKKEGLRWNDILRIRSNAITAPHLANDEYYMFDRVDDLLPILNRAREINGFVQISPGEFKRVKKASQQVLDEYDRGIGAE